MSLQSFPRDELSPRILATRLLLIVSLTCLLPGGGHARAAELDHGPWESLLQRYVQQGQVDYAALSANAKDRALLGDYLRVLKKARPAALGTKDSRLAFWLNAYNACVLQEVLKVYPIQSVREVKAFFKKPACAVAGQHVSLDALENKIIRPRFSDPRIHFALVCAAVSCPPLLNRAWKGPTLDDALEAATRSFLVGQGADLKGKSLRLSKLFDWYASDFQSAAGSVQRFVARYVPGAEAPGVSIRFAEYDWRLNGR